MAPLGLPSHDECIACERCSARVGPRNVHVSETDQALCPSCFGPLSDAFAYAPFSHRPRPTVAGLKWALVALHGFHVCGASRRCLQRAEELRSDGYLVTALGIRGGGLWSDKFAEAFDELIFLRSSCSAVPPWLVDRLGSFAHVEAHYQPAISWCLDQLPDFPLFATFHTEPLGYYDDGPLLARLLDCAGSALFPTEALRQQYRELLPTAYATKFDGRSSLSPHTSRRLSRTSTALFSELQMFGVAGKRIGIVTRLDPDKLSPTLLKSTIDRVLASEPQACVIIAGPGEDSEKIRSLFNGERYNEHVHFTGYVDAVQDIYMWADVMFLPSWTEVRPFTVLEAASFGKLTVAPALPAMAEAFANEDTLVFQSGCSDQAAALLLATMQLDRVPKKKACL